MENNEIIQVTQLPVIIERLQVIKQEVDEKVTAATSLVCTEENVKQIKATRAELRKELEYWESERKKVKQAIMAPYDKFEKAYKDAISEPFKNADTELKDKIGKVEDELLREKTKAVIAYFNEYAQSKGIDFVSMEKLGIKVTLSASLKSLKEKVKATLDKISEDLSLIKTQENSGEILYEYTKCLNVSLAVTTVIERHKAVEAQKLRETEIEEKKKLERDAEANVKKIVGSIAPPVVHTDCDPVRTLAFKVTAPISKLKELKNFLDNGGYKYE